MSTDEQKADVVAWKWHDGRGWGMSDRKELADYAASKGWPVTPLFSQGAITALQERIKELELHTEQLIGLLEMLKEHWIEYDHVFSISVQEARSTLQDSGNGSEVAR